METTQAHQGCVHGFVCISGLSIEGCPSKLFYTHHIIIISYFHNFLFQNELR